MKVCPINHIVKISSMSTNPFISKEILVKVHTILPRRGSYSSAVDPKFNYHFSTPLGRHLLTFTGCSLDKSGTSRHFSSLSLSLSHSHAYYHINFLKKSSHIRINVHTRTMRLRIYTKRALHGQRGNIIQTFNKYLSVHLHLL